MKADRIEFLRAREKHIREALAIKQTKLAKHHKRQAEKEQSIIWPALLKAFALSPEFKVTVAQTALPHVTDEKQRRFLAGRGWNV